MQMQLISQKSNQELADYLEKLESVDIALIEYCCLRAGWSKPLEPAYGWEFKHCTTRAGGVVPFSVQGLIRALRES